MIRAVRGIGVLLIAIAVIVGPPVLVALWLIDHPPSLDDLSTGGPMSAGTIVALGTIPVVVVWLVLSVALLRRGIRQVRAHLRMPTPSQVTAGSMAGAIVLGGPAVVAVTAPATPAAAATTPAQDVLGARGVTLPDGAGWVPAAVGQAVATTAAALWLRRRRAYRPGESGNEDLRPLPVTVNALTSVIDASAPPVPLVEQLPPGGLALTGPGAGDALRGLLITLLLGGRSVVMTWADLGELLGDPYRSGPLPAGLRAVDELESAGADETALRLRPHAGTGLGHPATTWEVGADGTVAGARRLCVLNPRAAADLLQLLTLARPVEPVPIAVSPAVARLRLLGGCELSVEGSPVVVRRRAGLQVLAYLGLHPAGATGHELIAAIWPGLRPASIANRLHVTTSELRKDLVSRTAIELLRHENGRYILTGAVEVDVHRLSDAIAGLERAITPGERGLAQRAVVDAYAGELAFDCDWPWLIPLRETFRRQALTAYVSLADSAEPDEAVQLLRAAMTVDPHNEDVLSRVAAVQGPRRPRPYA
ncbi:AfsR/SARP family transcriptional regulator [Actinoplanes sp. HUAS TT8]|uniref:AfsR/SARP family transcriptional regulator n=1 Tax=Actinoplanes sp. HUAS TT8 TaxID=3447453 RepID=UPI003F5228A3